MADVTISYKGNEIATMSATGVKTLLTGAQYCEDDITVAYTKPQTPAPSLQAKTNIAPTTSSQTITPDSGYDGLSSVQINAMPSGSASTPATTITVNPTIQIGPTTGTITAGYADSRNITPTVSPGYVSSGTAGTITVNGQSNLQLTTKAAATYTPTTTAQTIASGQYLTGAQTISGDANLVAENIKKDVSIFGVTGTFEGGGGGSSQLFIFTEAGYMNASAFVNGHTAANLRAAFSDSSLVSGATITFYTYGDYILDSITGLDSGNPVPYTTVSRGNYSFTMPNESVYCALLYDD